MCKKLYSYIWLVYLFKNTKIKNLIAVNLNILFLDVCKTSYGKHAENKE